MFADATVAPAEYVQLWQHATQGDLAAALRLHGQLAPLGDTLSEREHVGLKYALHCLGLCSPEMSRPFARLTPDLEARIRRQVATLSPATAVSGSTG